MEIMRFSPYLYGEAFGKSVGRLYERVLDSDIMDTVFVGSIVGATLLIKEYFEIERAKFRNNIARAVENRNITPLNPQIVEEIDHITLAKGFDESTPTSSE